MFAVSKEVERQIAAGSIQGESLNAYLKQQLRQIRDFEGMWVSDAQGFIHWGTEIPPGAPVHIADREYFQRLRNDPGLRFAISQPVIGRITKTWSILVARRINHPDGSIAGVALGSLRVVDYFIDMFSAIDIGKQGVNALRDAEMALIVRHPQVTSELGQIGSKSVSTQALAAIRNNPNSGSYVAVGAPDDIERAYSYQKVGDLPLYIFVGQGTHDLLSAWRREAFISLSLGIIFTLISILYTRLSYKRTTEILANEALARQKDALELIVAERTQELVKAKEAAEEGWQNDRILMASIVQSSDDAIAGMALDGTIKTWNPGTERMLGYLSTEMTGRSVFEIIAPERQAEAKQALAAIQRGESVIGYETVWVTKERKLIDISVTASPVYDTSGRLISASVISRDITERKRTETALRKSEERFQLSMEATHDGLWDWNAVSDEVYYSPACYHMLGYEVGAFPGTLQGWKDLLHPDDIERVMQTNMDCVEGRCESFRVEYRLKARSGEWRWILGRGKSIARDAQGRSLRLVGTNVDITERKQAEVALQRANRALRTLSDGNEALVRTNDEVELLKRMTQIIVETGGYHMAWVGYAEQDEAKSIRAVAQFGVEEGYLEHAHLTWADDEHGKGPSGMAIKTGQIQVACDILTSQAMDPWRELASRMGYTACIALPLTMGQRAFGVLCIYARQTPAFNEDEVRLLAELANELAYGIQHLRNAVERHKVAAQLRNSLEGTIDVIAATLESRDPYTAGHQRRVAQLAVAIAHEMELPADRIEGIHFGALIHDLGKIQVPSELLTKPTQLNKVELELIKMHPQVGYDIVKSIDFPWPVAAMIHQHHERMDGSGYPQGLKGEDIALEARILAVADVVEAMASHRPYRPSLGISEAMKEIERGRGTAYDTTVADACLKLFREKGYSIPT